MKPMLSELSILLMFPVVVASFSDRSTVLVHTERFYLIVHVFDPCRQPVLEPTNFIAPSPRPASGACPPAKVESLSLTNLIVTTHQIISANSSLRAITSIRDSETEGRKDGEMGRLESE